MYSVRPKYLPFRHGSPHELMPIMVPSINNLLNGYICAGLPERQTLRSNLVRKKRKSQKQHEQEYWESCAVEVPRSGTTLTKSMGTVLVFAREGETGKRL